jgi:hypothetical protein
MMRLRFLVEELMRLKPSCFSFGATQGSDWPVRTIYWDIIVGLLPDDEMTMIYGTWSFMTMLILFFRATQKKKKRERQTHPVTQSSIPEELRNILF